MKRLLTIVLAAAALLPGLWSCSDKDEKEVLDTVELRYRVADSYTLDAVSAKAFSIVVTSTKPWTITSAHPDWCIITQEDGAASDPDKVRYGQGDKTTVKVQYYDNTELDDRTDYIEIRSDFWLGKKVSVTQKGIAYLEVPEEDLELDIDKDGGELYIHVNSNQNWTSAVTSGDWLSVKEGASGTLDGVVTLLAEENSGEKRYATVEVRDRHDVLMATINVTQDGVQLDPETLELRAGYDQLSAELKVISNGKWEAVKDNPNDDWFTIENPANTGDATLEIKLTENTGEGMRNSIITLQTIAANEGDFVVKRTIVLKQAYKITPVRYYIDNDAIGGYTSDWANKPVYTAGVGTLFTAKARLNKSMPFGTYTFRWHTFTGSVKVRHWLCFSESAEIKVDIRPAYSSGAKISFDFNAPGGVSSQKPTLSSSSYSNLDWTKPIELTIKFDPSGSEYCHVTYLVNGVEAVSYDTSENTMRTTKWGSSINMYYGADLESGTDGSAILEWMEYTAPMNWDE